MSYFDTGTGAPVCPIDPAAYSGTSIEVPALVTRTYDPVVVCVMKTRAAEPGIGLEKTTNGEDADTPTGPTLKEGEAVDWTYVVTNTGNVDLTNVTVTDDQGVVVSCPRDSLAPGQDMTCTATGTAEIGQYTNIGIAECYFEQTPVTDSDPSHYLGTGGSLTVNKMVVWNNAAPDATRPFEICVSGPSFAQPECHNFVDGDGEEIEVFGPKSVTAGIGGQRSDNQRIYLPLTLSLR